MVQLRILVNKVAVAVAEAEATEVVEEWAMVVDMEWAMVEDTEVNLYLNFKGAVLEKKNSSCKRLH